MLMHRTDAPSGCIKLMRRTDEHQQLEAHVERKQCVKPERAHTKFIFQTAAVAVDRLGCRQREPHTETEYRVHLDEAVVPTEWCLLSSVY